jgi:DNA-binding CsgD family transcriptional regulator
VAVILGDVRQVRCPVLIGRDEERRALVDMLEHARAGRGGTCFVVGEAGVGKSRLAREIGEHARSAGMTVLIGRAVPDGVPVAFRPLAEAVLGGLRHRGEVDPADLRPFLPALGRLVPQWLPSGKPPEKAPGLGPVPGPESPVLLGEGLLRLLRVLGGAGGCLLVLEDLHWADPESLAVLEYLSDNLTGEPVVCVGTLRSDGPEPGPDPGRGPVARMLDRRAAGVVELRRLTGDDAVRLARACLRSTALPAPVEELVRERADGLPFLVEELLAGLIGGGSLVERDGSWTTSGAVGAVLPSTFAGAVARRLSDLPAPARAVLHAAAVLGRRFDWTLLAAVTGRPDAEVAQALRQATEAQLVVEEADGFRFRHALTRDAVLGDLLAPQRARLAGSALKALERSHPELAGPWCELAADLAETAGDQRRAADLLLTAGRRALSAGALATAEAGLHRARRLAAGDAALTMAVDDVLTDVYALSGQVDRAFDLGNRLLARLDVPALLPSGGAELHVRLARAAVAGGRWSVAAGHLAAARELPAAGEPGLAARIGALEAQTAIGWGRLDDAARLASAALAVAERAGLAAVVCEALEVTGRIARQRDLDAAEAAFARSLAVATAHGLELWRLRALHELGTLDQLRTESVQRLCQARELAVEVGALALVATLDLQIAAGLTKQFRADDGLAAARRSAEASRRLRLATLPMALVHQAAAYAQRGQVAEMEACLAEASSHAPDDLDVQGSAWGHCRAVVSLLAEDRARALAEMTTGAALLSRSPATVAPPFLGLRVLLMAVDGDPAGARAEAALVRGGGATRHKIVASLLGYADAVLLGRAARAVEAAARFETTDADLGPLVAWYRQYARRLVAEAALADGWGAPLAWLREAAAYFASRGEQSVAAACRALLRRAGAAVPRPGRADADVPAALRALGVTSREASVLALVADGLTNKELAARLHLSPRTVEKHVASLLAKTGCRRRAQLAGYTATLTG